MPERKGRRRRNRDRRDNEDAARSPDTAVATAPPPRPPKAPPAAGAMPSNNARATGFIIAVITAFLSVLMIRDAVGGDHSTAEAAIRIAGATLMILLAIVVGVLVLIPAQLRRYFAARRGG